MLHIIVVVAIVGVLVWLLKKRSLLARRCRRLKLISRWPEAPCCIKGLFRERIETYFQGNCYLLEDIVVPNKKGNVLLDYILVCPRGIVLVKCYSADAEIMGYRDSKNWSFTSKDFSRYVTNPLFGLSDYRYILSRSIGVPIDSICIALVLSEGMVENIHGLYKGEYIIRLPEFGKVLSDMYARGNGLSSKDMLSIASKIMKYKG